MFAKVHHRVHTVHYWVPILRQTKLVQIQSPNIIFCEKLKLAFLKPVRFFWRGNVS